MSAVHLPPLSHFCSAAQPSVAKEELLQSGSTAPQLQSHWSKALYLWTSQLHALGSHTWMTLHTLPGPQVPHVPPQPSLPQFLSTQLGTHLLTQTPLAQSGLVLSPQVPHEPPQPSSPHSLSVQSEIQAFCATHSPTSQTKPLSQLPHEPPQPSSPHALAPQWVTQVGLASPGTSALTSPLSSKMSLVESLVPSCTPTLVSSLLLSLARIHLPLL